MVLIAKKQIEQSIFFKIKYIYIYLINSFCFFSFTAVLLNDVENVCILGLDQGCVLLFSAISSSVARVNIFYFP
jgi:hypothetical protein